MITPVQFSGLGVGRSTVYLKPFDASPPTVLNARREVACLTLKASLCDVPSDVLCSVIVDYAEVNCVDV